MITRIGTPLATTFLVAKGVVRAGTDREDPRRRGLA
jgi:hypothetical protein